MKKNLIKKKMIHDYQKKKMIDDAVSLQSSNAKDNSLK